AWMGAPIQTSADAAEHFAVADNCFNGVMIRVLPVLALPYCRSVSNHVRTPRRLGMRQSSWFNCAGAPGSTRLTQQAPRLVKLWYATSALAKMTTSSPWQWNIFTGARGVHE